jgi:hypothetical protein
MPNLSKIFTLELKVVVHNLITKRAWRKLLSMKTVPIDYGGFKFAQRLHTFRWLPQTTVYAPQKLTRGNLLFDIAHILLPWYIFFSLNYSFNISSFCICFHHDRINVYVGSLKLQIPFESLQKCLWKGYISWCWCN